MARVKFDDGTVINFDGTPSPQDIEEAYNTVKGQSQPQEPEKFDLARGLSSFAFGAGNSAAFGIPAAVMEKGFGQPTPQGGMRTAGEIAGFLGGGPMALGRGAVKGISKVLPRLAGKGLGAATSRAAIEGGVSLGSTALTNPREIPGKAALGAAGGAVIPPIAQGLRGITGVLGAIPKTTAKGFPKFGSEIRSSYKQVGDTLRTQFDEAIKKLEFSEPDTRINIRNVIERAKLMAAEDPAFSRKLDSAIRRAFPKGDVTLAEFVNNPQLADAVTLRQSQQVIASLKAVPSLPGKLARQAPSFTDTDLNLLDLANDVREAQLQSFPQFADDLQKYASVNDAMRKTKKFFSESRLEGAVNKGFGSSEEQKMVRDLLPQNIMQAITDARRAQALKGLGGLAAKGAVGGGAAAVAGKGVYDLLTQ